MTTSYANNVSVKAQHGHIVARDRFIETVIAQACWASAVQISRESVLVEISALVVFVGVKFDFVAF